MHYFNGLVQACSNSIANALELLQSCTKPLIWCSFEPGWRCHMASPGQNMLDHEKILYHNILNVCSCNLSVVLKGHKPKLKCLRALFTNRFSIAVQIRRKFTFLLMWTLWSDCYQISTMKQWLVNQNFYPIRITMERLFAKYGLIQYSIYAMFCCVLIVGSISWTNFFHHNSN